MGWMEKCSPKSLPIKRLVGLVNKIKTKLQHLEGKPPELSLIFMQVLHPG